jgi:phosphopantothenoylcysteine decarboxylase/phosphopantothenate--cysteine ligase
MATYMSAKSNVYFAPAMDLDMYKHKTTGQNIKKLQSFGNILIPPTSGDLASGLIGEGRMAEPEEIVTFIENDISSKLPLHGKKVLITAGPTYEAIDPVRFIGNHSSGKMGFALADCAAELGARVVLIAGPSNEKTKNPSVEKIDVVNADEMFDITHQNFNDSDVAIFAAAVADYTPTKVASQKMKKKDTSLVIDLQPTKDILASVGKIKENQFLVGFALETNDELENAKSKLKRKNLDLIVLNSLKDKGAGFKSDTNKVTLIDNMGNITSFELKSKRNNKKNPCIESLQFYFFL